MTTKNKKQKNQVFKGIIPSQNAIRYSIYILKVTMLEAKASIIVGEGVGRDVTSLYNQAHDIGQVVQFLEERLIEQPKKDLTPKE